MLKCHTPAEIPLKAILYYSVKLLELEFKKTLITQCSC